LFIVVVCDLNLSRGSKNLDQRAQYIAIIYEKNQECAFHMYRISFFDTYAFLNVLLI